jgi:hypothetical protein
VSDDADLRNAHRERPASGGEDHVVAAPSVERHGAIDDAVGLPLDDRDPRDDLDGQQQQRIRAALVDEKHVGFTPERAPDPPVEGRQRGEPVRPPEPIDVDVTGEFIAPRAQRQNRGVINSRLAGERLDPANRVR